MSGNRSWLVICLMSLMPFV